MYLFKAFYLKFVNWLDGVILVFNIDDELSSSVLPGYYNRMSDYRDFSDIPVFLVGIKGKIFINACQLRAWKPVKCLICTSK